VDLDALTTEFQRRFDAKMAARERALPAARQTVRSSANAIRAIHRLEFELAERLMAEAKTSLDQAFAATADHLDFRYAGYVLDAEKEYTEARLTFAVVRGEPLPHPDELGVEVAPYLGGMSEAIGEARRHLLDRLRKGEVEQGERLLEAMDDMYAVLVAMDYPDAITGNLRRYTDVARGILERTRGDLTMSIVLTRHTEVVASG